LKPIAITLLAGVLPCVAVQPEPAAQALVDDTKTISQGFMESLKGELQRAIKAGGPVAAIEVCNKWHRPSPHSRQSRQPPRRSGRLPEI
jgi:hypothetical protein